MSAIENKFLADGIQKMVYLNKEILVIDYSNRKEADMIKKIIALGDFIKKENRHVLLLAIFNDRSFATPSFLHHTRKVNHEVGHLIDRKALIGLNLAKRMILKGQNLVLGSDTKSFNSMEEAVQYLLEDETVVQTKSIL